jgi:hypothetical protein
MFVTLKIVVLLGLILTFLFNPMFTLLLSLTVIVLAFLGGFYAGIKNAKSEKVSWGKEMLNKLKSKE